MPRGSLQYRHQVLTDIEIGVFALPIADVVVAVVVLDVSVSEIVSFNGKFWSLSKKLVGPSAFKRKVQCFAFFKPISSWNCVTEFFQRKMPI